MTVRRETVITTQKVVHNKLGSLKVKDAYSVTIFWKCCLWIGEQ